MIPDETLYSELVPTLGVRALPALFIRLREGADSGNGYLTKKVAKAIARIGTADAASQALQFLNDPSARVQRAGMMVVAEIPCPEALDRLWELHCQSRKTPAPFLSEHEHDFVLYEDSFGALRAGSRLNPEWLEKTIARADPDTEPVSDLAYLVANLDDGRVLWRRCKSQLRTKIPQTKERSLATNIARYQDVDEAEWLLQRLSRADDSLGPAAFHALMRIDDRLALEHLDRIPERELHFTRQWYLPELLARRPEETRARLLRCLQQHADPWEFALILRGQENAVDAPILNFLLDALVPLLRGEIAHGIPANRASVAWFACDLLMEITNADLLECFRQRRGTVDADFRMM